MPLFIEAPSVTVIGHTEFVAPTDVVVDWRGDATDGERLAEFAGRMCYQSWNNPAKRTNETYLRNILEQGHGSTLEHSTYALMIEGVSRSLTHELIRHRAGTAVSQLSQRYVDESDVSFVIPPALLDPHLPPHLLEHWRAARINTLKEYQEVATMLHDRYRDQGMERREARIAAYEAARAVLPNCTETKLVMTANVRAWRHILALRGSAAAEAEIRRWAVATAELLRTTAPNFFQDVTVCDGIVQVEHPKV